jgi:hypothetical protein
MRRAGFDIDAAILANQPSLFQLMSRLFYQFTWQGKMSYQFNVQNEQSTDGVTPLRPGGCSRPGMGVGGFFAPAKANRLLACLKE